MIKYGSIIYDKKIFFPNNERIEKWYNSVKDIFESTNLNFYLCGASLQNIMYGTNIKTKDVDVVVTGENLDNYLLKNTLNIAMNEGKKLNIFVDIFFREKLFSYIKEYEPVYKIRTWENAVDMKDNTPVYNYSKKDFSVETIIDGLYKITYLSQPDFYTYGKKMMKEGKYELQYKKLNEIFC